MQPSGQKKTAYAKRIGKAINTMLYKNGINKTEFARALDISPSLVTCWIKGKSIPNAALLLYWVENFGLKIDLEVKSD